MKKLLHIGTSGFQYAYWKNRFYPEGLAASKQLEFYSGIFNTVEINGTFYRFPTSKSLTNMAAKVPANFRFTIKAHKIITHTRRMVNAKEKVIEFLDIVTPALGSKLACILYQLPPSYSYTAQRLEDVINSVPNNPQSVIEFRHASWWQPHIFDSLKAANITFCSVSFPGLPEDDIITSSVYYKRMHGVPELFKSSYTSQQLQALVPSFTAADNYIYFNNTYFEAGYSNAQTLLSLTSEK